MKKLSVILVIIICIGAIIGGRVYYHQKIHNTIAKANTTPKEHVAAASEKKSEPAASKKKAPALTDLTANLPKDLQKKIQDAKDANNSVTVEIVGEASIKGLGSLFQKQLDTAYGKGLFQVKTDVMEKKNSLDIYHAGD